MLRDTLFTLLIILLTTTICSAQNASFGISYSKVLDESRDANQWSADIRYQFTSIFSASVEVSQAAYNDGETVTKTTQSGFGNQTTSTQIENVDRFTSLSLLFNQQLTSSKGFSIEANLGGGFFKNDRKYFGLLRGGLLFSARLSDHVMASIPVSYQFVTWLREDYLSMGVTLRYQM